MHSHGIRSAWNLPLMAGLSPRGTPCIMQTCNSRMQLQGLPPCASAALSGCVCTHAVHMCSPCLRAVFSCLQRQAITDNPEWAFQRRRSRATAERSRASLADHSARAGEQHHPIELPASAECLPLLSNSAKARSCAVGSCALVCCLAHGRRTSSFIPLVLFTERL